jgi:hypothetical protein
VVDEVVTGPVATPDYTPPPKPMRLRLDNVSSKANKSKAPRYPSLQPMEVRLDKYLTGEVAPPFMSKKTRVDKARMAEAEEEKPETVMVAKWAEVRDRCPSRHDTDRRKRAAAIHFASDGLDLPALRREAVHSRLHAPVREEAAEEGGIFVVARRSRSKLDANGRPRTAAYLGKRLVPRKRATAREYEEWVFRSRGDADVAAAATINFVEERDIRHKPRAQFTDDILLPGSNVSHYTPLAGEENLHASHPRVKEKKENVRAIPRHPNIEEPWSFVGAYFAPRWE